jgi:hypothetical protein
MRSEIKYKNEPNSNLPKIQLGAGLKNVKNKSFQFLKA